MKKINISLDEDLLLRLDQYAVSTYSNRSAVISSALVQTFRAIELQDALIRVSYIAERALKEGKLDEETREEFAALESLTKFMHK